MGRERRAELRREREEGAAGGVRRCPELELLGPAREGAPDWEGRVDWRVRDLVVAVWVAKWWWVEWKVGGGG